MSGTPFSNWLKENIENLGLSYDELAKDLGVSSLSIRRWASGETSPRKESDIDKLIALIRSKGATDYPEGYQKPDDDDSGNLLFRNDIDRFVIVSANNPVIDSVGAAEALESILRNEKEVHYILFGFNPAEFDAKIYQFIKQCVKDAANFLVEQGEAQDYWKTQDDLWGKIKVYIVGTNNNDNNIGDIRSQISFQLLIAALDKCAWVFGGKHCNDNEENIEFVDLMNIFAPDNPIRKFKSLAHPMDFKLVKKAYDTVTKEASNEYSNDAASDSSNNQKWVLEINSKEMDKDPETYIKNVLSLIK